MAILNLVPHNTNFDFIGKRKITFSIVIISTLIFMSSLLFKGLNYGIDFKGGVVMEVRMPSSPNIHHLREQFEPLKLGEVAIQEFGSPQDLMIKFENIEGKANIPESAVNNIKAILGDGVEYRKIETVGPKVGDEMVHNGLMAILYALLGIMIYVAFRFEWRFGICAIIALAHDCFLILGMYSLFPLEFNETAITAILITAGYSINDTIVVLDRIRENVKRYRKITLIEILNKSINETLSRTILTVVTTFLSVLALFLFGGPVIAVFVLPILVSLIIGTLSSIFVASPLLLYFNVKHGKALDEEEERIAQALQTEGLYELSVPKQFVDESMIAKEQPKKK
ncbi:MAG: protein translocase subunit SecF [Pseudomonadota bacterium]|jgi:preprotein translocase subunit SecF|nr:protein translocase subunit SecF [Alphaproteobacteria bacterium]